MSKRFKLSKTHLNTFCHLTNIFPLGLITFLFFFPLRQRILFNTAFTGPDV